jgi:hypothetical protein
VNVITLGLLRLNRKGNENLSHLNPEDPPTLAGICERCGLAALGWYLGLWIFKNLNTPGNWKRLAGIRAGCDIVRRFGETLRQRIGIFGGGGGWFLLLVAGPLALVNWLIVWRIPGRGIALAVALVMLLKVWMVWIHRNDELLP